MVATELIGRASERREEMLRLALIALALCAVSEALVANPLALSNRKVVVAHRSLLRLQEASDEPVGAAEAEEPPPPVESSSSPQGSFWEGSTTVGTKTIDLPPAVLVVGVSVGFCVFVEGFKLLFPAESLVNSL